MSHQPIHALLFDMDGVVIDTHSSVEHFWNQLADKYQVTLTDTDFEQFIHGTQAHMTLARYFPMLTDRDRQTIDKDLTEYEDNLDYQLMSGILDLLTTLKTYSIPTALVTSGSQRKVDAVFAQFPLDDKFDVVITADVVRHGKPDPECYEMAANKLSIAPPHCIVFEDSLSGTKAGLSAGAQVIGIGKTQTLIDIGADYVIPNFDHVNLHPDDTLYKLQLSPKFDVIITKL